MVIGATGQIGSELTLELRKRYGDDHVIAGYIPSAMPKGELKASGPSAIADVTDRQSIEVVARQFKIDTIYNLAALLSVVAESRPAMAWKIGIDGLWNVLEVAREYGCAVFTPSSIGSFGEATPHVKTPQDTIQRPRTMYGVTKVTTELLSDYYYTKYGVDTRAVRFPGIISNVTPPGGGMHPGVTCHKLQHIIQRVNIGFSGISQCQRQLIAGLEHLPDVCFAHRCVNVRQLVVNRLHQSSDSLVDAAGHFLAGSVQVPTVNVDNADTENFQAPFHLRSASRPELADIRSLLSRL